MISMQFSIDIEGSITWAHVTDLIKWYLSNIWYHRW